jgi:hypothetical protein
MATYVVPKVPLYAQGDNRSCWYHSARMVYDALIGPMPNSMIRPTRMLDPKSQAGAVQLVKNYLGLDASQVAWLKKELCMKEHSNPAYTYRALQSLLANHGALWVGLEKNWSGNQHEHVVVVCGVSDTGVKIHDPEPVYVGTQVWLTWAQYTKAVETWKNRHSVTQYLSG